jgi:hypothetical protein
VEVLSIKGSEPQDVVGTQAVLATFAEAILDDYLSEFGVVSSEEDTANDEQPGHNVAEQDAGGCHTVLDLLGEDAMDTDF